MPVYQDDRQVGCQLELDLDHIDKKRALVAEARATFGIAAARRLWVDLGLPDVTHGRRRDGNAQMIGHFRQFLAECVIEDPCPL